jgi:hypothetical protein
VILDTSIGAGHAQSSFPNMSTLLRLILLPEGFGDDELFIAKLTGSQVFTLTRIVELLHIGPGSSFNLLNAALRTS